MPTTLLGSPINMGQIARNGIALTGIVSKLWVQMFSARAATLLVPVARNRLVCDLDSFALFAHATA